MSIEFGEGAEMGPLPRCRFCGRFAHDCGGLCERVVAAHQQATHHWVRYIDDHGNEAMRVEKKNAHIS